MSHSIYVQAKKRTIPLVGKNPITADWQHTPFSASPIKGNFGVALDPCDLVVDIDPRNGGDEGFEKLCRDSGVNLKSISKAVVKTGSGGWHIYFRKNPDVKIRKKMHKIYAGIEFLTLGSQVVGAGSIHPDTRKPYGFIQENPDFSVPAPQVLINLICKDDSIKVFDNEVDYDENSDHDIDAYEFYLDNQQQSEPGERNDRGFILACKGKDYGLTQDLVRVMLEDTWNSRLDDPLPDEELDQIVKSAFKYGTNKAGVSSVSGFLNEVIDAEPSAPKPADQDEKMLVNKKAFEYDNIETTNAQKFLASRYQDGELVRYQKEFYCFNGKYFEKWDDDKVASELYQALLPFGLKQSIVSGTHKSLMSACFVDDFKEWENTMCFRNGVLLLESSGPRLVPHDKKYRSMSMIDVDLNLEAHDPRTWIKFLESSLEGDPDRIALLQEWMGYNLVRGNKFQKICLLVGASRCGKGTIGRIIEKMTKAVGTSLNGLCGEFGLSILLNAKSAVIGDAHKVKPFNYERAKEVLLTISGLDKMDVNDKNRKIISDTIDTKLTLMANSMPTFSDGSDALINRYLVIPFRQSFSGKEDFDLDKKLERELSGIINWAIKGFYRLNSTGKFTIGRLSKAELDEIQEESNPIKSFTDEYCEIGEGHEVSLSDLYRAFQRYCVDRLGFGKSPAKNTFGSQLRSAYPKIDRKRNSKGVIVQGMRLRELEGDEDWTH